MDGMPRLPMISPDFRHPTTLTFPEISLKVKEYILTHYEDDPTKYEAALSEIESLRGKLCSFTPDVETVCLAKRYYAQLRLMKSRFPMEEGDPIHISFSWTAKDSDGVTCSYDDVNFELACVMYDIGAIHAAIAAAESRIDSDSIKNAFTHFQCAAYPFQYIRDNMNVSRFSVVSFDSSLLTWFFTLMLAQAQECILEKSLIDHRKNTIVAKIATYLKEAYKQCAEQLRNSCAAEFIPSSKYKEWMRTCEIKFEVYDAISLLFLGDQAEQDQKMGARLLFYELAEKHVTAALRYAEKDKRETTHQALSFISDVVGVKAKAAKKDNDFIYHDRVPSVEELSLVEAVTMVKPIPFDPTDRSVSGDDLFAALLPMNVLKAVSVYSEEKAKFKREIMEKIRVKDEEVEAYLLSLQLDEIDLDSDVIKLPDSLMEKSAAFNAQPDAFPELLEKLKRVGDCAVEAEEELTGLRKRLARIDLPELTSDEGFLAITKEVNKLIDDNKKARENNTKLQKAIATHSENLRILAMPLAELTRRITGPVINPSESEEGASLNKLLTKVEEMRKQRKNLFVELCTDLENDDISAKCLAEKEFDNNELFKKELAKHEKMVKLIDMNLSAQANILNKLTEANANFATCRRQVMDIKNSRKDQVLALTAAYEVYCNVLQKANEGVKFYSTLFIMIKTLGGAVEGVEEAYALKKDEINKVKAAAEERALKLKLNQESTRQHGPEQCTTTALNNTMMQTLKSDGVGIPHLSSVPDVYRATASYSTGMQPVHGTTAHIQHYGTVANLVHSVTPQSSFVPSSQNSFKPPPGAFLPTFPPWNNQIGSTGADCRDPQPMCQNSYEAFNPTCLNGNNVCRNMPQSGISLLEQTHTATTASSMGITGVCSMNVNPVQASQTYMSNFVPTAVGKPLNACGGFVSVPQTIPRPAGVYSGNVGDFSWKQNQQTFLSAAYRPGQPAFCGTFPSSIVTSCNKPGVRIAHSPVESNWTRSNPVEMLSQPTFPTCQLNTPQSIRPQVNGPVASGVVNEQAQHHFSQQSVSCVPQQQVMDVMNSVPTPNLPEPLIPQKTVTDM